MQLSRNAFDRLVERAIADLPDELAQWVDEVPIIVEDDARPGEEAVGLYEGHDLAHRSFDDTGQLPSRIFIYRRPLMDACATRAQLAEEIWKTLIHELGHHAGLDEDDLARLGYGDLEEDITFDTDDP